MRGMLAQATVDALEGNALVIGVVDALSESLMRERLPLLEAAVRDVLRTPLRVVVRTRGGAASRGRAASAEHAPNPRQDRTLGRSANGAASVAASNGEDDADLMAYTRKRLGGTET